METATVPAEQRGESKRRPYQRSQVAYPYYDLSNCVAVAHAIHHRGGGYASREHLAAYLGYKSAQNGAFRTRLAAARQFGLVTGDSELQITPLAQRILMPEREEHARQGLVDAFLTVPLFRTVYEAYRGQELPEGLGLRNAMHNRFHVAPNGVDTAIKTMFDSADAAGFFDVRNGSRTQLIIPQIQRHQPTTSENDAPPDPPPSQTGGGSGTPPRQGDAKTRLLDALIEKVAALDPADTEKVDWYLTKIRELELA